MMLGADALILVALNDARAGVPTLVSTVAIGDLKNQAVRLGLASGVSTLPTALLLGAFDASGVPVGKPTIPSKGVDYGVSGTYCVNGGHEVQAPVPADNLGSADADDEWLWLF